MTVRAVLGDEWSLYRSQNILPIPVLLETGGDWNQTSIPPSIVVRMSWLKRHLVPLTTFGEWHHAKKNHHVIPRQWSRYVQRLAQAGTRSPTEPRWHGRIPQGNGHREAGHSTASVRQHSTLLGVVCVYTFILLPFRLLWRCSWLKSHCCLHLVLLINLTNWRLQWELEHTTRITSHSLTVINTRMQLASTSGAYKPRPTCIKV